MTTQTNWNSSVPVPVDKGGTGASSMTSFAPVCGGTSPTAPLQEASSGQSNVGYVLTSTGASSLPTWQAAGGGGVITTLDGDTSFASAPTVALIASPTAGSTTAFVGNGVAQIALRATDVNSNTAWGQSSILGGTNNTGIGAFSCTSASGSSTDNVGVGVRTANFSGAGSYNTCIGSHALDTSLLGPAVAPSYNVCIGYSAGTYYQANESSNILINNLGSNSGTESNTLRIGAFTGTAPLQLNQAFICGIQTIVVTGTPVLVSTSDQLGVAASSLKFKENVQDMGSNGSQILNLRPVIFNWKEGIFNGETPKESQYGLIAEEVDKIFPYLVVKDDSGNPLSVKYNELPAILLNELQKALRRIESLENKINST